MNPPGAPRCPYRGLVPFAEADAGLFFGRDAEIRIVAANLLAARLTLLYGDSGVGKSSILHAGVVPHLRRAAQTSLRRLGRPRFHVVVVDRWQDDPLASLAERLNESLRTALGDREPPQRQPGRFAEFLAAWTEALGGSLLFIFDQFEEYLRYHERESGEATFAEEFPRAVTQADLKVNFLLAVREDEYARLDRFKPRLPGLYRNYLRLRYLGPEAAREAIVKPLEVFCARDPAPAGPARIEPELVDAILEDVRTGRVVLGEAGLGVARSAAPETRIQTPYLQLVLTRVWQAEAAAGSAIMRLATYRDLGGADRIVRAHLDGVLDDFPRAEQATAAAIFRHLVTPSGAKVAHSLTDLADYARCPLEQLQRVLDRLCGDVRILRPVPPSREQPEAPRFEIYTDSLAKPVLDWGTRFRRAQEQAEAEAKLAEERRRKLVFLRLSVGLAAAFLLAATLGALAWRNWREALVREAITRAAGLLETDPEASVRALAEAGRLMWLQPRAIQRHTEGALREALLVSHRRPARGPVPPDLVRTNAWQWTSPDSALVLRRSGTAKGVLEMRRTRPATSSAETWEPFDTGLNDEVLAVAFGPRTGAIAMGGPGAVRVWHAADLPAGSPRLVLAHTNTIVRAAAFSPDESLLATVGDDAVTRLWQLADGTLTRSHAEGTPGVNDVAFSPDGRFLATARNDHTAVVWQVADGKPVAILRGHGRPVMRVRFSADGQRVWTADAAAEVRCWASRTGRILAEIPGAGRIVAAAPMPGGMLLASAATEGGRVWRQAGGTALVEVAAVNFPVMRAAFSANGRLVALAGRTASVEVRDVAQPAQPPVILTASNQVIALSFAPDPALLATVDRDGHAMVWRWREGMHGPAFRAGKAVDGHVLFDRAGTQLILASGNQPQVFALSAPPSPGNVVTQALLTGPLHGDSVTWLALAADGAGVLSADASGTVQVWNLASGHATWSGALSTRDNAVGSGAFAPNGRFVVTGGAEGVAHVWDLAHANLPPLLELPGHRTPTQGDVVAVWFADDGRAVFTAGRDGTVRRHATEELGAWPDLMALAAERLREDPQPGSLLPP